MAIELLVSIPAYVEVKARALNAQQEMTENIESLPALLGAVCRRLYATEAWTEIQISLMEG